MRARYYSLDMMRFINEDIVTGDISNSNSLNDAVDSVLKGSTKSATPGFEDWLNKGNADNKVYFGIKKGEPQYTGITKQTLDARLSQHNANGKDFQRLEEQFSDLTRNQARAIEQYFIENGPNEMNKSKRSITECRVIS